MFQFTQRDAFTYRMKLPYCTKFQSLKQKLSDFDKDISIVSSGADLSLEQTRRLIEIKKNTIRHNYNTDAVIVKYKRQKVGEGFQLPPAYKTFGSSGADLNAWLPHGNSTITLFPGQRVKIPTGTYIELPNGYEAQIRSKASMAETFGITVLNSPNTIDSDHRGLISVTLINNGQKFYNISHCQAIAQLVVVKVTKMVWHEVESFTETKRSVAAYNPDIHIFY